MAGVMSPGREVWTARTRRWPDAATPVIGLWLAISEFRHGLGVASALAFARQAVTLYEELAGICPRGSAIPVDYQNLAGSPRTSTGTTRRGVI